MNKNQNIAMGISLAVVAIMVGSAEIFGEKEIIFPEITAVAMGALIAPVQSWNTSRTRLFAAIVSVAVAGVCIVRFIPEILILRIALGLLVAVSVITLSKANFVPAISACTSDTYGYKKPCLRHFRCGHDSIYTYFSKSS